MNTVHNIWWTSSQRITRRDALNAHFDFDLRPPLSETNVYIHLKTPMKMITRIRSIPQIVSTVHSFFLNESIS